jgi:hypothetical protein
MHTTPPLLLFFVGFVVLCCLKCLVGGDRTQGAQSNMRWIARDGTVWPTFYQKLTHDDTVSRRSP